MIKIGKYIYIIYQFIYIRYTSLIKSSHCKHFGSFSFIFQDDNVPWHASHGKMNIIIIYLKESGTRYIENNVRVSLLIGVQVIPLDWNSSASLCSNMTGLSYWLLGKQLEKTTQQHEYLHLRLCLTKRTVCSVVYLHQDSFDNNKRCGLQKLPTCVPGRLSARHGWVNMITAVAHINI